VYEQPVQVLTIYGVLERDLVIRQGPLRHTSAHHRHHQQHHNKRVEALCLDGVMMRRSETLSVRGETPLPLTVDPWLIYLRKLWTGSVERVLTKVECCAGMLSESRVVVSTKLLAEDGMNMTAELQIGWCYQESRVDSSKGCYCQYDDGRREGGGHKAESLAGKGCTVMTFSLARIDAVMKLSVLPSVCVSTSQVPIIACTLLSANNVQLPRSTIMVSLLVVMCNDQYVPERSSRQA
jgi:hypothetical protein